jgi:hypothetical protein
MSTTTSMTLPQLGSGLFLTDGGIETSLIFIDGLDPRSAASNGKRIKPRAGTLQGNQTS